MRALAAIALLAVSAGACAQEIPDDIGAAALSALTPPWIAPAEAPRPGNEFRGLASWYGLPFHGRRTASGERFDMNALTAAHPTLPFGTRVRVSNPRNGRSVDVRINDRGPHVPGRIIDLSHAAARALGLLGWGAGTVVIAPLPPG